MSTRLRYALIILLVIPLAWFFGVSGAFSNFSSSATGEFNAEEAKAAANLTVSMPPSPTSTAWMEPSERAEVVTGKKASAVSADAAICAGSESSNFNCYQTYYQELVKNSGIPAAFADLKVRYERSEYIKSQCHPLTHVIGRAGAEGSENVSDAYAKGDSYCWSGYYHGVLETIIGRIGLQNLKPKINSICSAMNADGKYSFNYFNCVHGLGHGLMAITDDELFKSLDYCSALTGDWEQQSCGGGVYMENVIVDGLNHTTKYLDPMRPQYPCDESPDKYKGTCYLMQTSYMLKINGGDWKKTFEWCRDAGSYTAICNQSLGRDASGRSVSDGPKTYAICMQGSTDEEKSNCVIGAVKDFVSYFHSDKQAHAFCDLFTTDLKKTCRDTADQYYTAF